MAVRNFESRESNEADYVFIGSGMAGLTCASLVANAGHSVMVLESHPDGIAGGCMHTFNQSGHEFACGVHYTGNHNGSASPSAAVWHDVTDGQELDVMTDKETVFDVQTTTDENDNLKVVAELAPNNYKEVFGCEAAPFSKLVGWSQWLFFVKMLWWPIARVVWFLYWLLGYKHALCRPYEDFMKETTGEKEVRPTWWIARGDHGVGCKECPAVLQSVILHHYSRGTVWPRGGFSTTVQRMANKLRSRGGQVLVKARVEEILFEGNRAVGVMVEGGHRITARKGVVNAAGVAVGTRLAKGRVPEWNRALETCGQAVSHACIFLTYDNKRGGDVGLPPSGANVWHNPEKEYSDDGFFISHKNSDTGCHVFVIWESKFYERGPQYATRKEDETERMWERVLHLFPLLANPDSFDSSTPATSEKYLGAPQGSSYGLKMATERFGDYTTVRDTRPIVESHTNLFLASQDTMWFGLVGAMMSGALAAQSIIHGESVLSLLMGNVIFIDLIKAYSVHYKKVKAAKEEAESQKGK